MKRRTVTLAGKRWVVRWVARLGRHPEIRHAVKAGDCDVAERVIRVIGGQSDHEERRVLLHEFLHAEFPWLDEDAVDAASERINVALTRCGFPPERKA